MREHGLDAHGESKPLRTKDTQSGQRKTVLRGQADVPDACAKWMFSEERFYDSMCNVWYANDHALSTAASMSRSGSAG